MIAEISAGLRAAAPGEFWSFAIVVLIFATFGLGASMRLLARRRFLEDLPVSLIQSAAQGYVQLEGRARLLPGPEIVSPLSGARCVWWSYSVEESTTDEDGDSRWSTIDSGTSDELFLVVDPTGECIVDPVGATIEPSLRRSWRGISERPDRIPETTPWFSSGSYRFSEQLVRSRDFLVATGWFRTQSAQHEFDEKRDVLELLREWKQDRRELLRRFDADRSGEIDLAEWETARRAALEEVRAQHVDLSANPDLDVFCKPPDSRPFILSALPRQALIQRQRTTGVLWLLFAIAAAGVFLWALRQRGMA